jgi:hypothetical protein
MTDHVHILLDVARQFAVYRLVKAIKARSSRLLRQEFPWLESHLATLWITAVSSRQWAARHSPLSSDASRTRRTFECAAPCPLPHNSAPEVSTRRWRSSGIATRCAATNSAQAPQASPRNRQAEPRYGWLADFDAMSSSPWLCFPALCAGKQPWKALTPPSVHDTVYRQPGCLRHQNAY